MVESWRPTHRHRKGGLYELIGYGRHTETDEAVAIYRSADGIWWVRPAEMFDDGRFEPVAITTGPGTGWKISDETVREVAQARAENVANASKCPFP
jgi:hypothetical protein